MIQALPFVTAPPVPPPRNVQQPCQPPTPPLPLDPPSCYTHLPHHLQPTTCGPLNIIYPKPLLLFPFLLLLLSSHSHTGIKWTGRACVLKVSACSFPASSCSSSYSVCIRTHTHITAASVDRDHCVGSDKRSKDGVGVNRCNCFGLPYTVAQNPLSTPNLSHRAS